MTTILTKTGSKGNAIEVKAEVRSKWGEDELFAVVYVDGKEVAYGEIDRFRDKSHPEWAWLVANKLPLGDSEGRAVKDALDSLRDAQEQDARQQLEASVLGYSELKAAYAEWSLYHDAMEEAIRNQEVFRRPERPTSDIDALKSQYPQATTYLTAEAYSKASNAAKREAGVKAMELLRHGGSIEEAQVVLDGWLTDEMRWS